MKPAGAVLVGDETTLQDTRTSAGASLLLTLFVACLLIPSSWEIAGIRLNTARLYALCLFIPLTVRWLAKEYGRVTPVDLLILFHVLWILVSLVVNHGASQIPITSMIIIEVISGYFVGRILIVNSTTYKRLFQLMLLVMAVLLPFAIHEMITERAILQDWFRKILGSSYENVYHPPRMGFYRAQTVMQHPILWGVFCSITIANVYHIWADRMPGGLIRMTLACLATFSSVSSGAVLSAIIQLFIMTWGWVTNNAWKVLSTAFAGLWIFLSLTSNRGPVVLMVTYLTFSPGTGWGRIHIWNYAIDDALSNPIFGIGLNDWSRPFWLASSVDNFWLVMMLRHGLVGFGFLAAALGWHIWMIASAKQLTRFENRLRQGYLIALVGLIFSLATVHFWGPPYVLMFAYIGAGVWFYERPSHSVNITSAESVASVEGDRKNLGTRVHGLPFSRTFDRRSDTTAEPHHTSHDKNDRIVLSSEDFSRDFSGEVTDQRDE